MKFVFRVVTVGIFAVALWKFGQQLGGHRGEISRDSTFGSFAQCFLGKDDRTTGDQGVKDAFVARSDVEPVAANERGAVTGHRGVLVLWFVGEVSEGELGLIFG